MESIDSIPRSDAFKKPTSDRNMIGFGFQVLIGGKFLKLKYIFLIFQTFVRVNSLYTEGFLDPELNTLIVKAKVVSELLVAK